MTDNKKNSKFGMMALIAAIVFVTYNVVLFAVCGFSDHGGAFWISYAFMMISFATLAVSGLVLKGRTVQPKDWLLGYPVLKHCGIYLILEFIASITFIALDYIDCPWAIAFAVQMVLLAVHLVFIISCFMAKEMIENVEAKVNQKTSYIRLLKVEAEMIAERATDNDVKNAFGKLAEQLRYSDPMSSEALSDLENRISNLVEQAKVVTEKSDLLRICNNISLLITERNKKCKVLK